MSDMVILSSNFVGGEGRGEEALQKILKRKISPLLNPLPAQSAERGKRIGSSA
jgi:hypothetical protein